MTRRRFVTFAAVAVWLTGSVLACWLTPAGPRVGWQPPVGHDWIGILADDRTCVTKYDENGRRLALWDFDTSTLRGTVTLPADVPYVSSVIDGTDLLTAWSDAPHPADRETPPPGDPNSIYRLTLVNARTSSVSHSFTFTSPLFGYPRHAFADQGRTLVVGIVESGQCAVDVLDTATGDPRHRFPGCSERIVVSLDGRRLAFHREEFVVVFDLLTGRELATFPYGEFKNAANSWPIGFSPDGTLLLDSKCRVFDVGTGRERYRLPDADYSDSFFTADGRTLVATMVVDGECFLQFYDARTGEPRPGSRRSLLRAEFPAMKFRPLPGRRLVVAVGSRDLEPLSQLAKWIARLPGLEWVGQTGWHTVVNVFDMTTGTEVWRG